MSNFLHNNIRKNNLKKDKKSFFPNEKVVAANGLLQFEIFFGRKCLKCFHVKLWKDLFLCQNLLIISNNEEFYNSLVTLKNFSTPYLDFYRFVTEANKK